MNFVYLIDDQFAQIRTHNHAIEKIELAQIDELSNSIIFRPNEMQASGAQSNTLLDNLLAKNNIMIPTDMTQQEFSSCDEHQFNNLKEQALSNWIEDNNLEAVAKIGQIIEELSKLLMQDRDQFIFKISQLIVNNVYCQKFLLIFNDLLNNDPEAPPQLVTKKVEGQFNLQDFKINDAESEQAQLLASYSCQDQFELREIDHKNHRFVFTSKVADSPMLFMIEYKKLNRLQLNLLRGIFTALPH